MTSIGPPSSLRGFEELYDLGVEPRELVRLAERLLENLDALTPEENTRI